MIQKLLLALVIVFFVYGLVSSWIRYVTYRGELPKLLAQVGLPPDTRILATNSAFNGPTIVEELSSTEDEGRIVNYYKSRLKALGWAPCPSRSERDYVFRKDRFNSALAFSQDGSGGYEFVIAVHTRPLFGDSCRGPY